MFTINVGVETEASLSVTRHGHSLSVNEQLEELARLFNKIGLSAYASPVDHEQDYTKWAITLDTSITIAYELDAG